MHYEELTPPPELRGLVHRLWILRGRAPADGPFQRAMPDGRPELIFNFADPFECLDGNQVRTQPLSLLVGPSRRAMAIRPSGRVDLLGIRFRPEALARWLRVRGTELADAAFTLGEVPAPLEATLHQQLAEAGGSRDRLGILGTHLAKTSRRQEDRRLSAAVDMILGDGRARPERIARAVGLSRRQLGRLFQEQIGITPKSLGRLGRFQRALRALDGNPRTHSRAWRQGPGISTRPTCAATSGCSPARPRPDIAARCGNSPGTSWTHPERPVFPRRPRRQSLAS